MAKKSSAHRNIAEKEYRRQSYECEDDDYVGSSGNYGAEFNMHGDPEDILN